MSKPTCFACADGYTQPDYIATAPHKDGGGKIAFTAPLCTSHANFALIAGWLPIHKWASEEGQKLWDEHGYMNPALPKESAS